MRILPARLRTLPAELQRRHVPRVALSYCVVAWLVIQAADILLPALTLPAWTVTLVVVLLLLGLPVALVLGWAYDLTPQGIHRTRQVGPALPPQPHGSRDADAGGPAAEAEAGGMERRRRPRGQLPSAATPLVGRHEELARLAELLGQPECRLLTIVGPGGVGKSRLAVELGRREAGRFEDGVSFISLSGLATGEFFHAAVADSLGLTGREEPRSQLLAFLRAKRLLLILDNFEHLVPHAPALVELLEHAPELKLLVTSRERLDLQAETVFPIQGLLTGPVAAETEAAQLFLQTARRARPDVDPGPDDWDAIGRICEVCEGVPLAIELAAAWMGILSCAEIAAEIERSRDFLAGHMRDVPERHRSLRAVFDSSWQLLSEVERNAFRRLSIFRSGFSREAANHVAAAPLPLLSSLLGKSLLRRADGGLYEIHALLRSFAEERLRVDARELAWVAQLHAEHYAAALRDAGSQLQGAGASRELDRIAREIGNYRAAWDYAVRERRADLLGHMLEGLYSLCYGRGWAREGEAMLEPAAGALADAGSETLRQRIRVRQGVFAARLGAYDRALPLFEEGLRHFRAGGELNEEAFTQRHLGLVASYVGRYAEARERFQESLRITTQIDRRKDVAASLSLLGNVAYASGDYEEAHGLWSRALELFRALQDRDGVSVCLKNLGGIAIIRERYAEAAALTRESLAIDRALGSQTGIAAGLVNLGCACYWMGDYAAAELHLREGASLCVRMGFRRLEAFCVNVLGNVALALDRLAEAEAHYRSALAIAAELREAPLMLEVLLGLAQAARRRDDLVLTSQLLALVIDHPASDERARQRARAVWEEMHPGQPRPATPATPPELEPVTLEILHGADAADASVPRPA